MWLSHSLPQGGSGSTVSRPQQPQNEEFVSAKWEPALLLAHLKLCSVFQWTEHCKESIVPTP